jgi:2-amino-4-hydroxy-6-hydroxymethyldihydropteridine diphosphokinase
LHPADIDSRWRLRGGPGPSCSPADSPDEDEVERTVDIDAEPPASELADRPAFTLLEPARQGVVGRQVGQAAKHIGVGHGDDVGGVTVVGERTRVRGAGRRDERVALGHGRQRHGPGAQNHDPIRTLPLHEAAETGAERCIVGRPALDPDVSGAGGLKSVLVQTGQMLARGRHPAFDRAGIGAGLGVENEDDDTGHGPSLARRRPELTRWVRAYVGLGANVGDPTATIAAAIHGLAALPGSSLDGVSRLYATDPVGVVDQPEFRNAAAAIDVPAGPDPATGALALLVALKQLERAFGRHDRQRWGPRELDLDLLLFGRNVIDVERPAEARSDDPDRPTDLVVPHRLAAERLFVLAPLADLAPRLVPPGWQETVASARRRREAVEGAAAVRPIARWADGGWVPLPREGQPPS